MKAVSLIQPYATLIMLGYKQYETRSWSTKHRGPLAIAASAGKPKWARDVAENCPIISELLARHGFTFDTLPRGGVLGVCDVVEMNSIDVYFIENNITVEEEAAGDYSMPGRWAWLLDNVRPLPSIVGCKGALSVWTVPESLAALVEHGLKQHA